MYNLSVTGEEHDAEIVRELFGAKYDLTDDLSQTNVLTICSDEKAEIPDSKLLFALCDMTENGLPEEAYTFCADRGIAVFKGSRAESSDDIIKVCDFIENGNVDQATGFPDISLGPFGDDVCRIIIMMKGIDDPILLAAMMFSGLDIRAISGGLNGDYGCALVALREQVTSIPHLDGVLKVRVLQDL